MSNRRKAVLGIVIGTVPQLLVFAMMMYLGHSLGEADRKAERLQRENNVLKQVVSGHAKQVAKDD